MKLFVAGLPSDFDEVDLREMFELYGVVSAAKLVTDRATGKSKGFGFVEMPDDVEAKSTIETLNGVGIGRGKRMSVQEATEGGTSGGASRGSFRPGGDRPSLRKPPPRRY